MSTNLLELLNAHLTEDVVSKIASFIGETNKNTGSALGSAVPSLLSGIIHKSSDSQGASILYNLLTQNHDDGLLSNLGASLVGGDVTTKLANVGGSLLNSVFGNKTDNIANVVANASGISKQSTSSLLGLLMPIVFAVLGKSMKAQQITSPAGLINLLGEQSSFLKNLVPAGLAGIFGLGAAGVASASTGQSSVSNINLSSSSSVSSANVTAAPEIKPAVKVEPPVVSIAKERKIEESHPTPVVRERKTVPPIAQDDDEDAGVFGKFLPWLILGSILALGWGIWKNLNKTVETPATASSSTDTATAVAPATSTSTDSTAPATTSDATSAPAADSTATAPTGSTGSTESAAAATPSDTSSATSTTTAPEPAATTSSTDGFEQKLSSGFVIKAPADSMESKLLAFATDANAKVDKDKWFTMDGILFDTNKSTIKKESNAQITNIIEILKAYPAIKLKIGGYTDNTGNAKANKKLSANRANAVKAAISKAGIKAGRLDAEGYGSEHPVASNDTAEGRQQNRRIDVRVTAK